MDQNTNNPNEQIKQHRAYIPPQVEIVTLMPKQTILGGCKTDSIAGPGNGTIYVLGCYDSGDPLGIAPCNQ